MSAILNSLDWQTKYKKKGKQNFLIEFLYFFFHIAKLGSLTRSVISCSRHCNKRLPVCLPTSLLIVK